MNTNTIAMILCAGLGTRMKPLTDHIPKAMIQVNGISLLEHNLKHISSFGIRKFVINVHYKAEVLIAYIMNNLAPKYDIVISNETEQLLDTGGGILFAKHHFMNHENILIFNVDILSSINLNTMLQQHENSGALSTLAVSSRQSSRKLLFHNNKLVGWRNTANGSTKWVQGEQLDYQEFSFSGIHVFKNQMLNYIKTVGEFSIIDTYLTLAQQHEISAYQHDNDTFIDVGTPSQIGVAEKLFT
jgi:NDP-sugar pyrophosphorylase family protein